MAVTPGRIEGLAEAYPHTMKGSLASREAISQYAPTLAYIYPHQYSKHCFRSNDFCNAAAPLHCWCRAEELTNTSPYIVQCWLLAIVPFSQSFRQGLHKKGTVTMSERTTGQSTKSSQSFAEDDTPFEAAAESPPALMLLFGLAEIVWGFITNGIQLVTSTLAFVSSTLAEAVRIHSVQDVAAISPKLFIIAGVIAGSVQIIVLMNAMPMSSVWRRMREVQRSKVNAMHAAKEVAQHMQFRQWLFIVAFIGDVIGDARFVTLFTKDWVSVGLWVIMLTASSTLVFFDGWQRVWGALQSWRDYKMYHEQHYS